MDIGSKTNASGLAMGCHLIEMPINFQFKLHDINACHKAE